jgi:energy-coupling factor transporter ATP-binding protein EcfA2
MLSIVSHKIDIDKFSEIVHGLKHLPDVADETAVFVIGNTGAGKTTFANFLAGIEMVPEGINLRAELKPGESLVGEMNSGVHSVTLYPELLRLRGAAATSPVLIDLPGLHDTRGVEERLCAELGIRMMLKSAKQVRGLVIMINVESFSAGGDTRGTGVSQILSSVVSLWQDPEVFTEALRSQLLFVISKMDSDEFSLSDLFVEGSLLASYLASLPEKEAVALRAGKPEEANLYRVQWQFLQCLTPERTFGYNLDGTGSMMRHADGRDEVINLDQDAFRAAMIAKMTELPIAGIPKESFILGRGERNLLKAKLDELSATEALAYQRLLEMAD